MDGGDRFSANELAPVLGEVTGTLPPGEGLSESMVGTIPVIGMNNNVLLGLA